MTPTEVTGVDVYHTRDAFMDACPAPSDGASRLWRALSETTAVVLEVPAEKQRSLCGRICQPIGKRHHLLVADVEEDTGEDGALLLSNGCAGREFYTLATKFERAESRLREARFGTRDEDVAELSRVHDRLADRLDERAAVDTSFHGEWLPQSRVRSGFTRSAGPRKSGSQTAHESGRDALSTTSQTRLTGGRP